jgi:hypothetical protein
MTDINYAFRARPRVFFFVAGLYLGLFVAHPASADVPLPARMTNPASVEEAWNVIRLATDNVRRLLEEQRPLEIAPQISLCSPALRLLARYAVAPAQQTARDDAASRAFRSVNLIARESMADNVVGARNVFAELQKSLRDLEQGFDEAVIKGEIYECPDHPDVVTTKADARCDRCGRKLLVRRIPYSFVWVQPDKASVKLSAHIDAPLEAGKEANVRLQLRTIDGEPVLSSDLLVMHGHAIHALVTGPDDMDFHHMAPVASAVPGEYVFSFTPALAGACRVYAGVVPAGTGLQEYPAADLKGKDAAAAARTDLVEAHSSSAGGLEFQFSVASGNGLSLKARQLQMIRISVKDAGGQPVNRLEPLMNAFAQLTGIYGDRKTVLQLHPTAGDILREDLRGGPSLGFKIFSPKPGFIRFYCEVKVDGKKIVAPFVVKVGE